MPQENFNHNIDFSDFADFEAIDSYDEELEDEIEEEDFTETINRDFFYTISLSIIENSNTNNGLIVSSEVQRIGKAISFITVSENKNLYFRNKNNTPNTKWAVYPVDAVQVKNLGLFRTELEEKEGLGYVETKKKPFWFPKDGRNSLLVVYGLEFLSKNTTAVKSIIELLVYKKIWGFDFQDGSLSLILFTENDFASWLRAKVKELSKNKEEESVKESERIRDKIGQLRNEIRIVQGSKTRRNEYNDLRAQMEELENKLERLNSPSTIWIDGNRNKII